MKAALYKGKKTIQLTELPMPVAGPEDVVIQTIYAGICGSDVAVYNYGTETGHKIQSGMEFGHEMVSKVVSVGKQVNEFKIGDRVYPYPLLARGDMSRAGSLGGFSEYILIPNAKRNQQLYLIPEKIDTKIATLTEPFTVGTRAAKQTFPQPGEAAIVYGAGTIGLAAAIALKFLGLEKIMLVDHSDYRLKIAESFGFVTVNSQKEDVRKTAIDQFGVAEFSLSDPAPNVQIYIDAAGHTSILEDFLATGPVGSRFITVGVNNSQVSIDFLDLIFGTKSIGGSGGYRPEDVQTVFEIMQDPRFDLSQVITQEFEWEELETAIQTATDVNQAEKVLINYHVTE